MSYTDDNPLLKMTANTAATCTKCLAVALAEPSAAIVSFQRHRASIPPDTNVSSAPCSLKSAAQFGGNNANFAAIAEFAA